MSGASSRFPVALHPVLRSIINYAKQETVVSAYNYVTTGNTFRITGFAWRIAVFNVPSVQARCYTACKSLATVPTLYFRP